jgi:Tol biopolymer transport system component/DNA-binding winged helix-turn-helix (wHTH) protein
MSLLYFRAHSGGGYAVETPSNKHSRLRFGLFKVDLSCGELYESDLRVHLQDKPFQILAMLLEQPGKVVTREEVRKQLWPDGTFVDFDQGLDTALKKLRYALGDSARSPIFIETIPRRGYRFVAPVISGWDSVPSGPPNNTAGVSPYNPLRITLGVLGLIAGFVLLLFVSGTIRDHASLEIAPIATRPGWERHPSFSPDGNQIVFDYVDENSASSDIYVQVLGDEKMLRLTMPPGASSCPSWSPDGQRVAYMHYVEVPPGHPERTIMVMSPLGGSERVIRRLSPENGSCRVSWSPNGRLLAYADKPSNEAVGVFLMSLDGSDDRRLTTAPDKMLDGSPAFSPDGQKIAFVRNSSMDTAEIYTVPSSGGEPTRLTFLNEDLGHPVWTSDGRSILFTMKGPASGGGSLYSVPSRGGKPERVLLPDSGISFPAISPHGDKIAYEKAFFSMAIWKLLIPEATQSPVRFIASTRTDSDPSFSPDGTKIAFDSTRNGTEAMWLCDADGSNPTKLAVVHQGGSPSWAPDGERIAFDDRHSGRSHIYLINMPNGSPEQITDGDFDDEVPNWSADGKSIYFASNRTGAFEIWKLSATTRVVVQITPNGGLFPSESVDGRFVYYNKPAIPYVDAEALGLWRIPVTGGPEELVLHDSDRLWQVRPEGVYFTDNTNEKDPVLKLVDLQTQAIKIVGHLGKQATSKGGHNLAISPDGRAALYVRVEAWNGELMLVKGGSW